ncbi:hypothetical protein GALL_525450 [mine drainage metagenome]|uniref:Uncharacterized protein n=1 Tax=mine drainage metagenome TaxID=410659 RepID=A0A1J5P450_9ZZZZ
MGFDHADHDIAALGLPASGGAQHLVGLADSRGHAQEDLQPPPPRARRGGEQGVRIGAERFVRAHAAGACRTG